MSISTPYIRTCETCHCNFRTSATAQRFCQPAHRPSTIQLIAKRNRKQPSRACPTCQRAFRPHHWAQRYCGFDCRPIRPSYSGGQSMFYRVRGMHPAEFAFMTIMVEGGHRIRRLAAGNIRFQLNGTTWQPDFYDPHNRTYYEVCGSRQALHQSKPKLAMMKLYYPKVRLKVVRPDGTPIPLT